MTRADEISKQLAALEAELQNLPPHETMSVRELARSSGVSPATAARFKAGDIADMQLSTVTKLMPFTRKCPCCGKDSDPEAWGGGVQTADEGPLFVHHKGGTE